MKILLINGSPKVESDTLLLSHAFLEGIKTDKSVEITEIDIKNKDIKPCQGCFSCMRRDEIRCVIDDDQNEVLEKIVQSDVIIYSFPLYFYSIPSHLKASWDRLLPLVRYNVLKVGDRYDHYTKIDMTNKKFIIISGCGLPNFSSNFKALEIICKNTFYTPICIFVPQTPILNNDRAKPITDPLINKFREAGKEFIDTLSLSDATIKELEKPMLDNNIYMEIINSKNE